MMWYIILSIFLFKFNLQHNTELMRYLSRGFQLLIPSLFLFCTCFMTSSGKISGDVSERCTSNSDRGASKYVFSLCIFVFCVHVVFFFYVDFLFIILVYTYCYHGVRIWNHVTYHVWNSWWRNVYVVSLCYLDSNLGWLIQKVPTSSLMLFTQTIQQGNIQEIFH